MIFEDEKLKRVLKGIVCDPKTWHSDWVTDEMNDDGIYVRIERTKHSRKGCAEEMCDDCETCCSELCDSCHIEWRVTKGTDPEEATLERSFTKGVSDSELGDMVAFVHVYAMKHGIEPRADFRCILSDYINKVTRAEIVPVHVPERRVKTKTCMDMKGCYCPAVPFECRSLVLKSISSAEGQMMPGKQPAIAIIIHENGQTSFITSDGNIVSVLSEEQALSSDAMTKQSAENLAINADELAYFTEMWNGDITFKLLHGDWAMNGARIAAVVFNCA